jgi:hypothetical protein
MLGGFKVRNFTYDGLGVMFSGGEAPYTADFVKWTKDPGIAIFKCSDGKERLIPSIALMGIARKLLPTQPPLKERNFGFVHIGIPSRS